MKGVKFRYPELNSGVWIYTSVEVFKIAGVEYAPLKECLIKFKRFWRVHGCKSILADAARITTHEKRKRSSKLHRDYLILRQMFATYPFTISFCSCSANISKEHRWISLCWKLGEFLFPFKKLSRRLRFRWFIIFN